MPKTLVPPEGARDHYGMIDHMPVDAVTIRNANGLTARLISYGARLIEFWAPDRDGRFADLTLGWDTLGDYVAERGCFGATCGRYANRIANARFPLDGETVVLDPNEGKNQLHGGPRGFDKRIWDIVANDESAVVFALASGAGDQGFPGNLRAEVAYRLTDDDVLEIAFSAETDTPTVVNLVNHAYWNLCGHDSGDILNHDLRIDADAYLPVSDEKIPLGEPASAAGTPFDFKAPTRIGDSLNAVPAGYIDHNYCLNGRRGDVRDVAVLSDPVSGRRMVLSTTEAGVQVYTAAHLDGTSIGKGGARYPRAAGLALETQTWPDAPNQSSYPSARLDPGDTYDHRMALKFTTDT